MCDGGLRSGLDGVPCPGMCSGIRLAAWTILAALILAGCTGTTNESGKHTTATSPPSLVIPSASLTLSGKDVQDAEFMALLIKWAKRDNYPLGDRDQLIAAGAQVCASMDRGRR
jgi:hypothetical protein